MLSLFGYRVRSLTLIGERWSKLVTRCVLQRQKYLHIEKLEQRRIKAAFV